MAKAVDASVAGAPEHAELPTRVVSPRKAKPERKADGHDNVGELKTVASSKATKRPTNERVKNEKNKEKESGK